LAIQSEAQRITRIIRELLDFARQSTPQRAIHNLNDLVQATFDLMEPLASKHHTTLSLLLPDESLDANIDAGQIRQVLTNLIINAIQSTGENGEVRISLGLTEAAPPNQPDSDRRSYLRISISDDGAGIAKSDIDHIFEPFYTTKDVGEGTGLGLSISHGIVQEHGGWIDVQSVPEQGSTFSVYLPKADGFKETEHERESPRRR
jgi:signal transduction histidine kinase